MHAKLSLCMIFNTDANEYHFNWIDMFPALYNKNEYCSGDLITISACALPFHAPGAQAREVHSQWIGPLNIGEHFAEMLQKLLLQMSMQKTMMSTTDTIFDIGLCNESHALGADFPPFLGLVSHPVT
jgi:hypothetical protein